MRNVPMIYHETEHGTIYCGDSLDVLSGMAEKAHENLMYWVKAHEAMLST
jgi:hypothetical protein